MCLAHSANMQKMVRDYINSDTFGLGDGEGQTRSIQDEQAIQKMKVNVLSCGQPLSDPAAMDSDFLTPNQWL